MVFSAFSNAGWDIYAIDDPQTQMRPVDMTPGTLGPCDGQIAMAVSADRNDADEQFATDASSAVVAAPAWPETDRAQKCLMACAHLELGILTPKKMRAWRLARP